MTTTTSAAVTPPDEYNADNYTQEDHTTTRNDTLDERSLEDRLWQAGGTVAKTMVAAGCRPARFGQRVFIVHGTDIVDFTARAKALKFLRSLGFDYKPRYYMLALWGLTHEWFKTFTPDVTDVMAASGNDLATYYPRCRKIYEMKTVIVWLLNTYGTDFFQLLPEDSKDHLRPVTDFATTTNTP